MGYNVAQKLIKSHLLSGRMEPGTEIELAIEQTLTQDATGTMVMLELEAMGVRRVKTKVSVQYVDHNLLQTDFKNADDHIFLESACQKFGIWFSRPGNGVSHPVHMENFGVPGATLIGSDSHTCAAGSLGMLAVGTGGLEVALAMAGEPLYLKMPKVMGVKLTGKLPQWVSAKDVILEMLRRHDVNGGVGKIIEYYGPGLATLDAMDRHVIANMGAELGATATVFPSDQEVKKFLQLQRRGKDWQEIVADADATYDLHEEINLSELEPLLARPGSPGNVSPVREEAGKPVYQCVIGSSANPSLRDMIVVAKMVDGKMIKSHVSFDINPTSRQVLDNLAESGDLNKLIRSGARIHQAGCNGCIGMGQAPGTGRISMRTMPRNFLGRSGTKNDLVYLCSPETAAASAITGVITDPRTLGEAAPKVSEPKKIIINRDWVVPPPPASDKAELVMGPNIEPFPEFGPLADKVEGPIVIKLGDNITTDEILPAGTRVLPFRSNIPEISKFTFCNIDEDFYTRAKEYQQADCIIVGGANYGQGSSREHAAITPRYLGVKVVIVKSFARIHRKNLINFGVIPLLFKSEEDWEQLSQGDILELHDIKHTIRTSDTVEIHNKSKNSSFHVAHDLSPKELNMLCAGGLVNLIKAKE
ncbi:aconitate hydratase [Simkania negevensis]|uniref:Aconitate hydratase n=1 Tax=Simkania negevensis TaxID=83561 RepID=A0ABS3AUG6_9BACT|nr:aconitate hydratase [Simkania negevensis]